MSTAKRGHYDSAEENDDKGRILIPFNNLINDTYCRDISLRVRSHLDVKRKEGQFIGSFAGYGYRKDPKDKNHLIIDEYAAGIVQEIFKQKLNGMSSQRIASHLNELGVLPPNEYKRANGFNYTCGFQAGLNQKWTVVSVNRILKNESYTGTLIQGKRRKINYKVKKSHDVGSENWIRVEDVEYVELLLNSVERCIAIRPCNKNNPNAIRWGRLKEGRWCASTLGCRGLAKTLFDIMEWDEDLRYRFRGQFLEQGDNKMMLFAFDEPEMIKVEEIVLPPKENTEEDEGETVRKKIYIFPPEWAGTFGQPITSIAQVGILRQEHYAGNWDVFRPASEIEEMNTFTAESLNKLLHEAEKIMEGFVPFLAFVLCT